MKKPKEPKILIYDIETSPNLAYVWGKYQQDVISFKQEWQMLCFAYKWYGQKTVHCKTLQDYKCKDDRALCKALWTLFNDADMVVAHYGDSFDQKKARARFVYHGFEPPAPFVSVDTKKVASSQFKFTSNKLNDLGVHLGLGEKTKHPGFDMWLGCMAGDKKSWKTMSDYNKQDVVLLERIYDKLKPWMPRHPNLSLLQGYRGCPSCGSRSCVKQGVRANHRSLQQQWQCKDCKAWFLSPLKKIGEYGE